MSRSPRLIWCTVSNADTTAALHMLLQASEHKGSLVQQPSWHAAHHPLHGAQGSTFGIQGVEQHAHFLREAAHSREIRDTLLANWNLANIPGRPREERLRLLHTVVVGGGPTGELLWLCMQHLAAGESGVEPPGPLSMCDLQNSLQPCRFGRSA